MLVLSNKAHLMHPQQNSGSESALAGLLYRLENEYYIRILAHCEKADALVAELHDGDVHQAASIYTTLCKKLTAQVVQYVRRCRFGLLPYLQELLEKDRKGHDCSNCTSSCALRRSAQIQEINDAHTRIGDTLLRLQSIEMSAVPGVKHADAIRSLHEEIALLDAVLRELFGVEEHSLLPGLAMPENGGQT
jgi:hypothetical protein